MSYRHFYRHRQLPPLPPSSPPPQNDELEFPCEDDKFSLPELVDGYSPLFPIRVRVVKGFYGERGESSAIATDELYNFHFVKRAKVVSILDVHGNKYVVPLNSAAKFGLIQEVGNKVYNTVEDILNAPLMPKIVAVKAGYVGDDAKTSVSRNEVLIIQGSTKGGGGRFKLNRPTVLKVFSVTKNEEKLLPKEVFGKFTTEPYYTQIYVLEFMDHIKDPVPSKVRLFLDFEGDQPLPEYLISECVTIDRLYMQTSIICSSLSEDELNSLPVMKNCDSINTMEIPISLDIEVSVIPPFEENDYEKLTAETMALLQNFDPSKVQQMEREGANEDDDEYSYTAQDQFFKAVRKGFENEGLKIDTPRRKAPLPGAGTLKRKQETKETSDDVPLDMDDYVDIEEEDIKPSTPLKHPDTPKSAPPQPAPYTRPMPPLPDGPKKRVPNSNSEGSSNNFSVGHYKTPRSVSVDVNAADEHTLQAIKPLIKPRPAPPKKYSSVDTPRSRSPSPPPIPPIRREASPLPQRKNELQVEVRKKSGEGPPPVAKRRSIASPEHVDASFGLREDLAECRKDIKSMKGSIAQLEELEGRVAGLEKSMKEVKDMLKSMSSQKKDPGGGGSGREGGGDNEHDPIAVLRMLDCEQVLQVLGILRMNKYKEIFKEALIDGEILAECDDEILEKELTISSRLDRLKLSQIITGKRSVSEVLHKPNRSYVAFSPSNAPQS